MQQSSGGAVGGGTAIRDVTIACVCRSKAEERGKLSIVNEKVTNMAPQDRSRRMAEAGSFKFNMTFIYPP